MAFTYIPRKATKPGRRPTPKAHVPPRSVSNLGHPSSTPRAISGSFTLDVSELEVLEENLRALVTDHGKRRKIFNQLTETATYQMLEDLILHTPVGEPWPRELMSEAGWQEYWGDYIGGNLRDGWQIGDGKAVRDNRGRFVKAANVSEVRYTSGRYGQYELTIVNPVRYAAAVNYGHAQQVGKYVPAIERKLKRPWIPGQHFVEEAFELSRKNIRKTIGDLTVDLFAEALFGRKWVR